LNFSQVESHQRLINSDLILYNVFKASSNWQFCSLLERKSQVSGQKKPVGSENWPSPLVDSTSSRNFWRKVKMGFLQHRKNNISSFYVLTKLNRSYSWNLVFKKIHQSAFRFNVNVKPINDNQTHFNQLLLLFFNWHAI